MNENNLVFQNIFNTTGCCNEHGTIKSDLVWESNGLRDQKNFYHVIFEYKDQSLLCILFHRCSVYQSGDI